MHKGQIVGEDTLWAESALGEALGGVERRGGSSTEGTSRPLPPGIDKKMSHYAQQLARHPEAITSVVAEAQLRREMPAG